MGFMIQHLFPCLPFTSSWVQFSGDWLCLVPFRQLDRVKIHLWRCENDTGCPPWSSKLRYCEMYIDHTYRIEKIPVCTQLRDWIWDAEWGFPIVVTGLQLEAGISSFVLSPSHSIEKYPHLKYFLVWGHGKHARKTWLHCTCWAVFAPSWSEKSTSGDAQACRPALNGGGQALEGRSRYREYIETGWILGDHDAMRVRHCLPWCFHCSVFYIGCDPARGVAC